MVLLAVAAVLTVPAAPARAASPSCRSDREARQPVVLVHGYNSGPDTWSASTRATIAHAGTGTCVAVFDYASFSTRWVTDPHIGPALAGEIETLARASRSGGGTGRVIVLAHSMGGLAARCAAAPSCNGGRHDVAGEIRELISFGTPNLGSALRGSKAADRVGGVGGSLLSATCYATLTAFVGPVKPICAEVRAFLTSSATKAFTPGSDQLRVLPSLPAQIPVYAVAGKLEEVSSFFGHNEVDLGDIGDVVVDEGSATAARHEVGGLGGSRIVDCGRVDVSMVLHGLRCWHSSETNDASFLSAAVAQIAKAERLDVTSPLATYTVYDYSPSGDQVPYKVKTWVRAPETRNCTSVAFGASIVRYLRTHHCFGVGRLLATTVIDHRPVGIAQAEVGFTDPPGTPTDEDPPAYGYAGGFCTAATKAAGAGGITSLISVGYTFPGSGSAIPASHTVAAAAQDDGCYTWDLWYLDGPTKPKDPVLTAWATNTFLQVH